MKRRSTTPHRLRLGAGLGLGLAVLAGSVAAAAPASAARPADCERGYICLYDGKQWTGEMEALKCYPSGTGYPGRAKEGKASSVINRCSTPVDLQNQYYDWREPGIPLVTKSFRVWQGVWNADLGGNDRWDNRTQRVSFDD